MLSKTPELRFCCCLLSPPVALLLDVNNCNFTKWNILVFQRFVSYFHHSPILTSWSLFDGQITFACGVRRESLVFRQLSKQFDFLFEEPSFVLAFFYCWASFWRAKKVQVLCCSLCGAKQPQRLTVFIASLSHQICISVSVMSVTPCPSYRFTQGEWKTKWLFPSSWCSASFCGYRKNHSFAAAAGNLKIKDFLG